METVSGNNVVENNIVDEQKKETKNETSVIERNDVLNARNTMKIDQNFAFYHYDDDDDDEIAASAFILFASNHFLTQDSAVRKRKDRTIWVSEWLKSRSTNGVYAKLLINWRRGGVAEKKLFRDFTRMDVDLFDQLLNLVRPFIEKQ